MGWIRDRDVVGQEGTESCIILYALQMYSVHWAPIHHYWQCYVFAWSSRSCGNEAYTCSSAETILPSLGAILSPAATSWQRRPGSDVPVSGGGGKSIRTSKMAVGRRACLEFKKGGLPCSKTELSAARSTHHSKMTYIHS